VAVDTPATIAIIGAGPIGLEAALYARFLGYTVRVFERGGIGENVRRWGHVRLFSPFSMNSSSLGRAALVAQDPNYRSPAPEALLTGHEWLELYLQPLAQTDLLADSIVTGATVTDISRSRLRKQHKWQSPEERAEDQFRILYVDRNGAEETFLADVVIDASGVYPNANWLGPGGAPAVGERALRQEIQYGLPDILGQHRCEYEGRSVLVVGSGYSAATSVVQLAALSENSRGSNVIWITRASEPSLPPLPRFVDDPLPERDRLAEQANQLAAGHPRVRHYSGWCIAAIQREQKQFQVQLLPPESELPEQSSPKRDQAQGEWITVDRIIANVGYRPDWQICRELNVHLCYVTEGPMRLAAHLAQHASADCLHQTSPDGELLLTTEPNFYVLGAKSYGRRSEFLYQIGLEQIRQLFAIIGDRRDLNLYETAKSLPQ